MIFGSMYNLFFKSNKDFSNKEKIEKLKQLSVGDTLDLLRNIEESPSEYDEEIIKSVYQYLFVKGIMCI